MRGGVAAAAVVLALGLAGCGSSGTVGTAAGGTSTTGMGGTIPTAPLVAQHPTAQAAVDDYVAHGASVLRGMSFEPAETPPPAQPVTSAVPGAIAASTASSSTTTASTASTSTLAPTPTAAPTPTFGVETTQWFAHRDANGIVTATLLVIHTPGGWLVDQFQVCLPGTGQATTETTGSADQRPPGTVVPPAGASTTTFSSNGDSVGATTTSTP